ncbi:MAG: DMT family transporter [Prevotella sp.]|nr:DMT family transporter [Prevotella sp.]
MKKRQVNTTSPANASSSAGLGVFSYHLLAILTIAIWGVTFVNTKVLLQHGLQPMEIFLLRFIVAYLCIWTISPRTVRSQSWADEGLFFVLGLLGGTAYFVAENTALGLSYVNNVSFIVCTAPLITMFLAIAFVKEVKATMPLIVGSTIALAGVGMVVYNGSFVLRLNPLGDMLALTAAICWAVYSLAIKKVSQGYSAVFITRKVFFYGIATVLPLFLIKPWQFPLEGLLQPAVWMNLLFLSIVASFLCFLWWSVAVKKIGALSTSNYVYLNPITTVVASALFLDEPMTLMAYIGSALILLGVYVANRERRPGKP